MNTFSRHERPTIKYIPFKTYAPLAVCTSLVLYIMVHIGPKDSRSRPADARGSRTRFARFSLYRIFRKTSPTTLYWWRGRKKAARGCRNPAMRASNIHYRGHSAGAPERISSSAAVLWNADQRHPKQTVTRPAEAWARSLQTRYTAISGMVKSSSPITGLDRVPRGWGSRISRHSAHEGGKVVSRTQRPPLPQGNIPSTHFCFNLLDSSGPIQACNGIALLLPLPYSFLLEAESTPGP